MTGSCSVSQRQNKTLKDPCLMSQDDKVRRLKKRLLFLFPKCVLLQKQKKNLCSALVEL